MWTVKTLIRPGGCPGWSEASLGTHAILLLSWGSYVLNSSARVRFYGLIRFRLRVNKVEHAVVVLQSRLQSRYTSRQQPDENVIYSGWNERTSNRMSGKPEVHKFPFRGQDKFDKRELSPLRRIFYVNANMYTTAGWFKMRNLVPCRMHLGVREYTYWKWQQFSV